MATENKCKCLDCKFNTDGVCTASSINLDYGPQGGCECLTYEVGESEQAQSKTPAQQASTLYG